MVEPNWAPPPCHDYLYGAVHWCGFGVSLGEELKEAIASKDVKEIESAIAKGANVNSPDSNGNRPLMLAIKTGSFQIVRLLIAHGADVSIGTELIGEIVHDNKDMVKLLLENGANPNVQDKHGNTPLILAASGSAELARKLKEFKQRIDEMGTEDAQELQTYRGYVEEANRMKQDFLEIAQALVVLKVNIDATDNDGTSALTLATEAEDMDMIRLLRKHGAERDRRI